MTILVGVDAIADAVGNDIDVGRQAIDIVALPATRRVATDGAADNETCSVFYKNTAAIIWRCVAGDVAASHSERARAVYTPIVTLCNFRKTCVI